MKKNKILGLLLMLVVIVSLSVGCSIPVEGPELEPINSEDKVELKNKEGKEDSEKKDATSEDEKKEVEEDVKKKAEKKSEAIKKITLGKPIDFGNFVITINNIKLSKDFNEKDVLVIDYDWENTSEESSSPFITFSIKGYQDNVETDYSVYVEDVDMEKGQKDVKPGGKIEGAQTTIGIEKMDQPLELELTRLLAVDKEIYSVTINPSELK